MRIALDAMGGDHAPAEVVRGAVIAAEGFVGEIVLVGDSPAIEALLPAKAPHNIAVQHASEQIRMHEKPTEALRQKRDSSIVIGVEMVNQGEAQAFVSAGNTGAVSACSLLTWRRIEGVHRPAIASIFPNRDGQFLLLDAGASPDIEPPQLVEFARMGRAYMRSVMGRPDARVHLLNIGEEPEKGNAFSKHAHALLAEHEWFAGNIEGKDMFRGGVDVVVCDAFTGNVVLKTAEGVAEFMVEEIKAAVPSGPAGLLFAPMRRVMAPLKRKMDYAEVGGSPLLGLNGLCIICHGRSNSRAIANAVRMAGRAVEGGLIESMKAVFRGEHERE